MQTSNVQMCEAHPDAMPFDLLICKLTALGAEQAAGATGWSVLHHWHRNKDAVLLPAAVLGISLPSADGGVGPASHVLTRFRLSSPHLSLRSVGIPVRSGGPQNKRKQCYSPYMSNLSKYVRAQHPGDAYRGSMTGVWSTQTLA
jgi:hypothetical protein